MVRLVRNVGHDGESRGVQDLWRRIAQVRGKRDFSVAHAMTLLLSWYTCFGS
jgi:hypothetical protein